MQKKANKWYWHGNSNKKTSYELDFRKRNILKLLEIIELRTSLHNQKVVNERLSELLTDINTSQGVQSVASYQHKHLETDFSIHIQYSSSASKAAEQLGKPLASALKELGLINHSVWVERN